MKTRLRLTEAAAQLGMGYIVMYKAILQGQLRGARIRGHWYVDLSDLERFIQERVKASATKTAKQRGALTRTQQAVK